MWTTYWIRSAPSLMENFNKQTTKSDDQNVSSQHEVSSRTYFHICRLCSHNEQKPVNRHWFLLEGALTVMAAAAAAVGPSVCAAVVAPRVQSSRNCPAGSERLIWADCKYASLLLMSTFKDLRIWRLDSSHPSGTVLTYWTTFIYPMLTLERRRSRSQWLHAVGTWNTETGLQAEEGDILCPTVFMSLEPSPSAVFIFRFDNIFDTTNLNANRATAS